MPSNWSSLAAPSSLDAGTSRAALPDQRPTLDLWFLPIHWVWKRNRRSRIWGMEVEILAGIHHREIFYAQQVAQGSLNRPKEESIHMWLWPSPREHVEGVYIDLHAPHLNFLFFVTQNSRKMWCGDGIRRIDGTRLLYSESLIQIILLWP